MTRPRTCVGGCGRRLAVHDAAPGPGEARHAGRGLCAGCRDRAERAGTLSDFPRRLRPRDEVLEDWAILRAQGYSRRRAAERIGVSPAALESAIRRGRAAVSA